MQAFLFFLLWAVDTKVRGAGPRHSYRRPWKPGIRIVMWLPSRAPCMFFEESFGEINARDVELFQNGSFHEFCCLKALITLELVNILVVKKGRRIALSKIWWGDKLIGCCKLSLYANESCDKHAVLYLLVGIFLIDSKARTTVKKNTYEPMWNEQIVFSELVIFLFYSWIVWHDRLFFVLAV